MTSLVLGFVHKGQVMDRFWSRNGRRSDRVTLHASKNTTFHWYSTSSHTTQIQWQHASTKNSRKNAASLDQSENCSDSHWKDDKTSKKLARPREQWANETRELYNNFSTMMRLTIQENQIKTNNKLTKKFEVFFYSCNSHEISNKTLTLQSPIVQAKN